MFYSFDVSLVRRSLSEKRAKITSDKITCLQRFDLVSKTSSQTGPTRPMKKIKPMLQETRNGRVFLWTGIRKNTPFSSKIHCYVKNTNRLDLNR